MNTFLDHLTVLAVVALLLAPSLYGALHDRHVDRRLRAAARERPGADTGPGHAEREEPGRARTTRPGILARG
ncbi:hypothetical protein AB0469_19000 [Streptomyces sp. NPDC093801]|uniref:hypothetical protein n=1 Tax=Streptomyces sp. NPDC093801 TaxID=3155203 RepID=UPI00344E7128